MASSASLENILGFMPLTEALRTSADSVPNPFPPELFTVKPQNQFLGDRAKYIRISGERRTGSLAKYGAPAKRQSLRDVGDQNFRCLHIFESVPIDILTMQKLMAFQQYIQDDGMDWLKYQFDAFGKKLGNTRVVATSTVLSSGNIYFDAQGNILPPSGSGSAFETYTFNIPATHQNQINGIIANSWALFNTDIPGQLRNLKVFAAEETGLPLRTALYGVNIPRYLTQNDYVKDYLSREPDMRSKFLNTAELPAGLFGIDRWVPVYEAFFEDQNGTNQLLWNADQITFLPDISQPNKMDWWAMYEGSYAVPKSLQPTQDPMAALDNFEPVNGMFSFALMNPVPAGLEVYHGDTFLPGMRNEKAPFMAIVAF